MPSFHPRLRFSLRTLFVLVTVLCVWLGYQLNWIRQRREALDSVVFGTQKVPPVYAPLPLRMLGEQGVATIWINPEEYDRKSAELRRLFPEAILPVAKRLELPRRAKSAPTIQHSF